MEFGELDRMEKLVARTVSFVLSMTIEAKENNTKSDC